MAREIEGQDGAFLTRWSRNRGLLMNFFDVLREARSPGAGPEGAREERMAGATRGSPRMTVLALTVGAMLGGCVDPGIDCWTREHYQAAARSPGGPIPEIRAGTYPGEVVIEDPENSWTGARFTGEPCRIEIDHRPEGTYVRTHFLDAAVRLRARMGPEDAPFFSGEMAGGKALVLQHHLGRPVSLTLTHYRADGTLDYGACGKRGAPFLECHGGRE